MAYLTSSNFKSIISKIDLDEIEESDEQVFEKPIFFLNSREKKKLIGMQTLLSDPDKFTKTYYKKVEKQDKLKYIFEGGTPAYHLEENCERLNSSFTNYEIPEEIKNKGEETIKEFRNWFKQNMYLLDKPDVFVARLQLAFGLKNTLTPIDYENSGIEKIENLDLDQLKTRIKKIISDSKYYYVNASPKKKEIISRYQKATFLGFSKKIIEDNETGFEDETLKKFLRQYDEHFKKPIKSLLMEYYRVDLNPKLKFEGSLLETLGFKLCAICDKNNKK